MADEISVKIVRRVNSRELIHLYKEAGWWKPEYPEDAAYISSLVRDSFCFAGAFHKKRLVGMGRSFSDGVGDAYIQDVTVLREFRGKGLGRRIVLAIVEHLRSRGIDWIGLIAEPGSERFYREMGFRAMNGYVPMIWAVDE
ncbi:MAG: GNAT family N-acetyltransferase [bacterium]